MNSFTPGRPAREGVRRNLFTQRGVARDSAPADRQGEVLVRLRGVSRAYGGQTVLSGINLSLLRGGAYVVTGESGIGKTTLLRLLLGLEEPDEGEVLLPEGYRHSHLLAGVVFQEDRLCEGFSAVQNAALACRGASAEAIRRELSLLLPPDSLDKPVNELSGGMRRRLCVVRACLFPSDALVMDEPFAGLDAGNRDLTLAYIRQRQKGRLLVLTSHSPEGLDFCEPVPVGQGRVSY